LLLEFWSAGQQQQKKEQKIKTFFDEKSKIY
jgi:hypothetical protein